MLKTSLVFRCTLDAELLKRPMDESPRLAFLGPPGSYSHQVRPCHRRLSSPPNIPQCAAQRFQDAVQYAEQPTISGAFKHPSHACRLESDFLTDVFRAVASGVPFAVIPQENSVYGTVIDTYDTLRSPEAGLSVFVRGELTLAVKHCLVVRHGVKPEDIRRVLSHEQVRHAATSVKCELT